MVISVASQKGGTGKTFTSISLAAGLARKGKRVLLVDIDSQANSSKVLLRMHGASHQLEFLVPVTEVRFGVGNSATFASATTLTSTGSADSFPDSYTALGGAVPLFDMMLGEVAPGRTGSGLYGMLILAGGLVTDGAGVGRGRGDSARCSGC